MDDELRRACIAYNSVLLHQPEDCRDQTAAMHAAISPLLSRLSAAEAKAGVLEEALRDEIVAAYEAGCAAMARHAGFREEDDDFTEAAHDYAVQALTQEPSHEPS